MSHESIFTPFRKVYRSIWRRAVDREIRSAARRSPLLLALGAGSVRQKGWIATDREHLDLLEPGDWRRYFAEDSVDAMLAEHVWEHLDPLDALVAAGNCRRFLKPGGYLRVAVPDGLHPSPSYRDAVKPMGTGAGAGDHKVLYTYETFSAVFKEAGFSVELLEYFDEEGGFQSVQWSPDQGMVERSRRFDARNRGGELAYTSIILDAWKKG